MRQFWQTHYPRPTEKSKLLSHFNAHRTGHTNKYSADATPTHDRRPGHLRALLGRMGHTLLRNLAATSKLLSVAFWKIFWFELVFHLVVASVVLTQTSTLLNFLMKVEHYSFITWELLPAFLSKPPALISAVVLLVALALLCAANLSCVASMLAAARFGKTPRWTHVLRQARRDMATLLKPSGWPLLLLALVLFPFLNASSALVVAGVFFSPQLIVEQVFAHRVAALILLVTTLAATAVAIGGMYAYPYFFYQRKVAREALKQSFRASKRESRRAAVLVGIKLLFDACAVGVLWLFGAVFEWSSTALTTPAAQALGAGFAAGASAIVFVLVWCLSSPLTQAIVTNGLWDLMSSIDSPAKTNALLRAPEPNWTTKTLRLWPNRLAALALAVVLIGSLSWGFSELNQDWQGFGAFGPANVSITAHRGASGDYPENTMPAFRAAALEKADWIELDVQQSKDGVIFVSHDSNFARISGVNKNAWELTYSEISQLDAGASFAAWWKGTSYPTLEEVIKWAKMSGQYLNIELKPTGHEHGFERAVANIVRKQNWRGYVMLTSQSYPCVQRLKQVAPDISRAYVTNFVYGNLSKLDAMDVWSVKYTSCTRAFVHYAHETGRPVLAWTTNTESAMLFAINNGVDGIITDRVDLARKAIADSAATAQVRTLYDIAMLILFG